MLNTTLIALLRLPFQISTNPPTFTYVGYLNGTSTFPVRCPSGKGACFPLGSLATLTPGCRPNDDDDVTAASADLPTRTFECQTYALSRAYLSTLKPRRTVASSASSSSSSSSRSSGSENLLGLVDVVAPAGIAIAVARGAGPPDDDCVAAIDAEYADDEEDNDASSSSSSNKGRMPLSAWPVLSIHTFFAAFRSLSFACVPSSFFPCPSHFYVRFYLLSYLLLISKPNKWIAPSLILGSDLCLYFFPCRSACPEFSTRPSGAAMLKLLSSCTATRALPMRLLTALLKALLIPRMHRPSQRGLTLPTILGVLALS